MEELKHMIGGFLSWLPRFIPRRPALARLMNLTA
jgi:hypothetical protein